MNPKGAEVALHRAGATLDDAAPVPFAGVSGFFPEGRYYLTASLDRERLAFPFAALGTGEGPEADGSWTITILLMTLVIGGSARGATLLAWRRSLENAPEGSNP